MKTYTSPPPGIPDKPLPSTTLSPQDEATKILEPLASALIDSGSWMLQKVLGNDPEVSTKSNEFRLATRRMIEGPFHSTIASLIQARNVAQERLQNNISLAAIQRKVHSEETIRAVRLAESEREKLKEENKLLLSSNEALQLRLSQIVKQLNILSSLAGDIK